MPSFHRHIPAAILLKHLGRGALIAILCTVILIGRLLVWLVRAIGWVVTKCRAKADG